jgi:hypothetical protein
MQLWGYDPSREIIDPFAKKTGYKSNLIMFSLGIEGYLIALVLVIIAILSAFRLIF